MEELEDKLQECERRVLLIGAPNAGKSVLFNTLTGRSSTVANWPGVTVDLHIGILSGSYDKICIIDLPGTYGLVPTSPEEEVSLEALLTLHPDLIVALLDSANPEGGLNLVIQLIEAAPEKVVVAVTKHAISHALGVHVDIERMSRELGVPVIPVSALEGEGVSQLVELLTEGVVDIKGGFLIDYGLLEDDIKKLSGNEIVREAARHFGVRPRWLALQLIANNPSLLTILEKHEKYELLRIADKAYREASNKIGLRPDLYIAERRLAFIERFASGIIIRREPAGSYWQKLADVIIHPVAGPVASTLGLLATFGVVFSLNIGFPLNIIFEALGFKSAAEVINEYNLSNILAVIFAHLSSIVHAHLSGPLAGLIGDGIIGGVGFVLSFLPLVILVYFSLGILEDSGIATRMAISFHPLFYRFGLSGKSVFPLLLGMGCNVPAELATKSLSVQERIRAVFAVPFIPCQARLAVIIAITSTLISGVLAQTLTVTIIYLEAITAALLTSLITARIIQPRIFKESLHSYEAKPELIMELPPIHKPHWRVIWWYVRDNTLHLLRKAGTLIFILAILTWALLSYGPNGYTTNPVDSYGSMIGEGIGEVTKLIGVGEDKDQVLGLALLDGLIAKEGVLTAIAISLGYSSDTSQIAVGSLGLSFAQALGFLVMITLYFPCIATLAVMRRIIKSWKLTIFYAVYSILIAVAFSALTYRVVMLFA